MPKKGHSEEQIVGALQRVESGEKVGEVWNVAAAPDPAKPRTAFRSEKPGHH